MTAQGRCLFIACALALLALPAAASGAPAKAPEQRFSRFDLESTNGYGVKVSGEEEGDLAPHALVSVDGGAVGVTYQVRAEPGAGLRATFGSLGKLDVRFERREKKVERPQPGCRWVVESGVFRGSFDFTGEGGYFSSSAVDPEGEVVRFPNGFCGSGGNRAVPLSIPAPTQIVLAARAADDRGTISFSASQFSFAGDYLNSFSASLHELVGGMTIRRWARASGVARRLFSIDGRSRASVFPPQPFAGSARFRGPPSRPPTWTGSLSVSFPGTPDVALAGPSFAARLCPSTLVLPRCRVGPAAQSSYGSGSHSQPLALARLSSLR